MPITLRNRRMDAGRSRAAFLRRRLGEELRLARVTHGLTQKQLARLAGVSQTQVSWAERGLRGVSVELACRLAAAAGCDLSLRLFPARGVRLRDSGQLAIAEAIVAAAHPTWHPRLEHPVAAGDMRAADLLLEGPQEVLHIEIERRLVDVQAQLRAATLKRDTLATRYVVPVRLVLALPDRRSSRDVVRGLSAVLGRAMPVASAAVRRAIASGALLGGDGIVFWPVRSHPPIGPGALKDGVGPSVGIPE